MNCPTHGKKMTLMERDRGGDDWMCWSCCKEVMSTLVREKIISAFEKLHAESRGADTAQVPRYLLKLAERQLRNVPSTCVPSKGKP